MKIIVGGQYVPTPDGSTVSTNRQASDPVPTCSFSVVDNNSSWTPLAMQEVLVLDDQVIPNPSANLLLNPAMNPYTTTWLQGATGSVGVGQNTGGGTQMAFSSASLGNNGHTQQGGIFVQPGQAYMLSVYLQGTVTPANIEAILQVLWTDAAGNLIGSPINTTISSIPTSLTRYSLSVVAPAGAVFAQVKFTCQATASGVTGTIAVTQSQFEPQWFPTLTYPLPWCGPAQTNCVQLPLGYWIRQYRKFAGFVNHFVADGYIGNKRTWTVDCVGYAWLMSTITVNDTFTSQTDAQIINTLLGKYLVNNSFNPALNSAMCTTTNVVTGQTVTSVQSNWDDLRTIFDNLAALSTYYWTVDYYWNFVYAPGGYFNMPISLICDQSSQPNMVTTFPAYAFSAEYDFTQPGSNILVIGSGTNVAQVIDPSAIAQIGFTSGYFLPTTTSWMRKVNESSLASVADCTNRGTAELIQYDYTRNLYHLSTNVELVPGNSVQLTSNTDNLNQSTQLIQQVQANWLGTTELLKDQWEYKADLGATNKAATNIISRIFRIANANSSAPAISTTTLALLENIGVVDTTASSITLASGYAPTILADTPLAYYRLGELQGTIADDYSGNANQGTLNGGITLNQASLVTHNAGDGAMLFDGTSGYINLPTSFVVTGAHAWSIECWTKFTAIPANGFHTLLGFGGTAVHSWGAISVSVTSGVPVFVLGTNSGDIVSGTISANTIYHCIGTYDGTSTRLYVNGTLVAGPTAFALTLAQTWAAIGAYQPGLNSFATGTIDEPAFYNYALSAAQVSAHYSAGI